MYKHTHPNVDLTTIYPHPLRTNVVLLIRGGIPLSSRFFLCVAAYGFFPQKEKRTITTLRWCDRKPSRSTIGMGRERRSIEKTKKKNTSSRLSGWKPDRWTWLTGIRVYRTIRVYCCSERCSTHNRSGFRKIGGGHTTTSPPPLTLDVHVLTSLSIG